MKKLIRYISVFILILTGFLSTFPGRYSKAINGPNDNNDTTNVTVVEFTVLGMDSISINYIQDVLDTTTGVVFDFACWSDTIVFIEYDSLRTTKYDLMGVIRSLGYDPKLRDEY